MAISTNSITPRQKFVFKALKEFGTCTSKQLSCYIYRTYNESITPASISGSLRTLAAKGYTASSNCGAGATYHWVNSGMELK